MAAVDAAEPRAFCDRCYQWATNPLVNVRSESFPDGRARRAPASLMGVSIPVPGFHFVVRIERTWARAWSDRERAKGTGWAKKVFRPAA